MTIKEKLSKTIPNETKIYAWYGDGDKKDYTLGERLKFFNDEGEQWRKWFVNELALYGQAKTKFAIYTTKDECPFN